MGYLNSRLAFKVFRVSTRFKKYNLGYTYMIRKKYSKRKHQTNWLNMLQIMSVWVIYFLKSRQFTRFFQTLNLFCSQTYSTDMLIFTKKVSEFLNFTGINFFSCSANIIHHFTQNSKTPNYYSNPYMFNKSSGFLINKIDKSATLSTIGGATTSWNGQLYPVNMNFKKNLKINNLSNLNKLIFQNSIKYSLEFYKVLILLSLLTQFKK